MKTIHLSVIIMLLSHMSIAQSITRATIGSTGGEFHNGNVFLNYTIGEPFVGLQSNGNLHLGTGFWAVAPTTYVPGILPVNFLSFTVAERDNNAVLNWQVENESIITDHYEIERSLNAASFKKIAIVQSGKKGTLVNSYNFTDLNLSANASSGIFYYRIKQFDKDGRFIYSKIRTIRLNSKGIAIIVYPNPIRDVANVLIDYSENASGSITIYNAVGKQIQNSIQVQLFKGQNIIKINLNKLTAGYYILKAQTSLENKSIALFKTN